MVKVVISQHSYPHDAGHSEVPTLIKHCKIDIDYRPRNHVLPKEEYHVFQMKTCWMKVLPEDR